MTPLNQKDILEAARLTGQVIPVHIYLYSHYENPYGYNLTTSKQLMDLVNSLDPRLVKIVGKCVRLLLPQHRHQKHHWFGCCCATVADGGLAQQSLSLISAHFLVGHGLTCRLHDAQRWPDSRAGPGTH